MEKKMKYIYSIKPIKDHYIYKSFLGRIEENNFGRASYSINDIKDDLSRLRSEIPLPELNWQEQGNTLEISVGEDVVCTLSWKVDYKEDADWITISENLLRSTELKEHRHEMEKIDLTPTWIHNGSDFD